MMENQRRPARKFGAGKKPSERSRSPQAHSSRENSSRGKTAHGKQAPGRPLRAKPERVRRTSLVEEPEIPAEITGEELPRIENFQLQSLALENAERVRKHLVALIQFLPTDPELAFKHGQAAVFRAGRIAIVRERAGIAGVESGHYEIAQKDLRAASRISGSLEVLPYIARCEVALGNPRKTLEIAGSVDPKKLSVAAQVMMRIAASKARSALGERDAAVLTLQCAELNVTDAQWSRALHREYHEALISAGRQEEAASFVAKFPNSFEE